MPAFFRRSRHMQRQGYTFPLDVVGRKVLKPGTFMKLWSLDDVKYIFDKKKQVTISPSDLALLHRCFVTTNLAVITLMRFAFF